MIVKKKTKYIPEVELLHNRVVLFLVFWGTSILFSILFPTKGAKGFFFSLHPCQHLLILLFLLVVILTGIRYLIVVLICIPLMISDVKHIFIYLFTIYMYSLDKNIYAGTWPILIGLVGCLYTSLFKLSIQTSPLGAMIR